jgi:hypothetical protein
MRLLKSGDSRGVCPRPIKHTDIGVHEIMRASELSAAASAVALPGFGKITTEGQGGSLDLRRAGPALTQR